MRTFIFNLALLVGLETALFGQPTITTQPTNQTASLFADTAFRVIAAGDAPLSYQWRFNDADLTGKTNATLTITNVQRTNAGNYSVIVTNISGSVTSKVATLTITPFNSIYAFGFSWTYAPGSLPEPTKCFTWSDPQKYYQGHACNGPMWPEFLSTNLGLAYAPEHNFAVCGATPEDILNQIIDYPAPPKPQLSLYCLWRGRPDVTLTTATNQIALDRVLRASISINSNSVHRLYLKGARVILFQFGLYDLFDFSGLTTNSALNSALLAKARDYSARFKTELMDAMNKYSQIRPDLRILFFDGFANANDVLANPAQYGFTETNVSALDDPALKDKSFTGPGADYLNWDGAHGTSKLHKLIAAWNLEVVTNSILEKLEARIAEGSPDIRMEHLQIGREYTRQKSADLTNWQEVTSFTASAGTNQWTAPSSDTTTSFYRLKWRPESFAVPPGQ